MSSTTGPTTGPYDNHADEYCGCCGVHLVELDDWCSACVPHIAPRGPGIPPWERTYWAQYHRDCPLDEHKFSGLVSLDDE